jgi:hypothetical protein
LVLPDSSSATRGKFRKLHAVFKTRPGQEHLWLTSDEAKSWPQDLVQSCKRHFRPAHPASWLTNPQEWLSSLDIQAVMHQYEAKYKDFRFLAVAPIDFAEKRRQMYLLFSKQPDCISPEICQLDVRKDLLKHGKTRAGIVFNLDRHDQSGSHWTALYLCFDPKRLNYGAFYYDSTGRPCPPQVARFMWMVKRQVVAGKKKFQLRQNAMRRQFKNTECGVFCMAFLALCLTDEYSFDDICRNIVPTDDDVHGLRRVFFRTPTT